MLFAAFPTKKLSLYFSDPYFDPLTVSNTTHVLLHTVRTSTLHRFGDMSVNIQGNYRYGGDDHVAIVHTEKVPMKAAIFVTSACHKAAHTGKFDYGHNFYAKDADALDIMLPTKDGKPDYQAMELLISAIQKLVIRDVVNYTSQKITASKTISKA